jgi:cell division protease FtsH
MALGGRVAEELVFDEVTTGAGNDLEQATSTARMMVTRYGMSEKLGPRTFGKREELVFLGREISEQRDYSDSVAQTIDEEVHRLIDTAQRTAREVLEEHRPRLDRISKYLLEHETIEEDQVKEVFDSLPPAADMSPAPMPAD